jgi:hypothetical protein
MASLWYGRHRFPAEIIQHAIWLYLRFTLSYRDVEELLTERGLDVSYETVRRWVLKFGCAYRLCHLNVVSMETAEPSDWCDTPDCLGRSMERGILVECKVRAHPIVVGRVIGQQMPEVPFPQHHDMVKAVANH